MTQGDKLNLIKASRKHTQSLRPVAVENLKQAAHAEGRSHHSRVKSVPAAIKVIGTRLLFIIQVMLRGGPQVA